MSDQVENPEDRFSHNEAQFVVCFLGTLCIIVSECDGLSSPGNGSVSTSNEQTTFGQVAVYSCHHGYDLIGNRTRMCQQNGNWSGIVPVCQVKGKNYLYFQTPITFAVNTLKSNRGSTMV